MKLINPLKNWRNSPSALVFIGLTLLYLFSAKGHVEIIDTEYSIRTARAIVEEGSLLIEPVDPDLTKTAPVVVDGKIYSKFGIGLALIFLPFVLAAKTLSFLTGLQSEMLEGFLISFYNIPFALGGLYFFHRLARLLGAGEKHALLATILLGIGTIHWKYAVTDFSESTQIFFLLGSLFFFLRNKGHDLFLASAMLSGLILIKVAYVAFLPVFGLYLLHREKWKIETATKEMVRFSSTLIVLGLSLAIFNYLRFDSPWETGYGKSAVAGWGWDYFKRDIRGIIFSLDRGCYAFNPILFAALPGWFFLAKKHPSLCLLLFSITALFFVMMAFRHTWQGGWAWGARTIVPSVPLLWLPFVFTTPIKNWQRSAVGVLAILSCYLQTVSVCQKTQEYFVIRGMVESAHSEVQGQMPPQLTGNVLLFNFKLMGGGSEGNYPLAIFGSNSSEIVSTADKETFRGFNLWYSHSARRFSLPILHLGMIIFIGALALLLFLAASYLRPDN